MGRPLDVTGRLKLPLRTYSRDHLSRVSDELHWPANDIPEAIVLMVPGNPGLVDFYTPFLDELHTQFDQRILIVATSHVGCSPEEPLPLRDVFRMGKPLPLLDDQIQSRVVLIDRLRRQYGTYVPIVLVGHSMGSWLALEVMKARSNDKRISHYGLFSTLCHIKTSRAGVSLGLLFSSPVIYAVTLLLVLLSHFVPRSIIEPLTNKLYGVKSRSIGKVMGDLIATPSIASTSLWMAVDEMKRIDRLDDNFLANNAHRLSFYFAAEDSDAWVRASTVELITSTMRLAEQTNEEAELRKRRVHRCVEGSKHAFVLRANDTAAVARSVSQWLREDCKL